MTIIGVAGQKKHGKDTVATYLKEHYGFTQRAFADELKEIFARTFDIPLEDCYDESKKELPLEITITLKHVLLIVEIAMMAKSEISGWRVHRIVHKMWSKTSFTSIRDGLQFIGTDILRDEVDADFHYNTVVEYFREKQVLNGVVSDVRFPNERDNLKRDFKSSKTILVVRPYMIGNETSNHASEKSLGERKEYDFVVFNDGSLQDLYDKVDVVMEELGITKGKLC